MRFAVPATPSGQLPGDRPGYGTTLIIRQLGCSWLSGGPTRFLFRGRAPKGKLIYQAGGLHGMSLTVGRTGRAVTSRSVPGDAITYRVRGVL